MTGALEARTTLETMIALAEEAGAHARKGFRHVAATQKGDGTLVTSCDRECEELIRAGLRRQWPEHSIYGEELGWEGPADNEWLWLLDPIDGTSNYIFGSPIWGCSIGLTHKGMPVAGVFHMPMTGETYWAWRGGGVWRNGQRVHSYEPPRMQRTDLVAISSTAAERYVFTWPQKIRAYGCAAYVLAAMAAGAFAAVVHDHWYPHDLAAGLLMCWEAGAAVTDLEGRPFATLAGLNPREKVPLLVIAAPRWQEEFRRAIQPRA